jgi:hypothetical protein
MLTLPGVALAQTWQQTLQIIVPFAPGASADGIGRVLATELASRLNRQVVVENKAGAGGALGLMAVAKASPDGDLLTLAATPRGRESAAPVGAGGLSRQPGVRCLPCLGIGEMEAGAEIDRRDQLAGRLRRPRYLIIRCGARASACRSAIMLA